MLRASHHCFNYWAGAYALHCLIIVVTTDRRNVMHCLIIVKTTWQEEMLCITIITEIADIKKIAWHCYNYTVCGNTSHLSHYF
jgi:hypothetical protein